MPCSEMSPAPAPVLMRRFADSDSAPKTDTEPPEAGPLKPAPPLVVMLPVRLTVAPLIDTRLPVPPLSESNALEPVPVIVPTESVPPVRVMVPAL